MYAHLRPVPNRPLRHLLYWVVGALAYGALTALAQSNPTATRISTQNIFANSPGLTHIPVQGGGSVSIAQASGAAVSTRIPLTVSTVGTGPLMNGVLRANPGSTLGTVEITAGARLPTGPGIPATVKVPVDKAQLGVALRNFAKKALPVVSTAVAVKGLLDDLRLKPPLQPDGPWYEEKDGPDSTVNQTEYSALLGYGDNWAISKTASCSAAGRSYCESCTGVVRDSPTGSANPDGGWCVAYGPVGNYINAAGFHTRSRVVTVPGQPFDDIVPDSRVDEKIGSAPIEKWAPAFEEVIRQGESIPAKSEPQLSGPSSVLSPAPTTSTTTGPNGQPQSTTTQQQRTNVTYNGNTYNTTTTTITNTTNNTTNETTTTTTENPEPKDPCEGNPNRAGCAELDVPEGEIPREEKNLTFSPVDLGVIASGCPAPIAITVPVVGQKFLEFDVFCDTAAKMRPFIVACSALTAMFILSFALRV